MIVDRDDIKEGLLATVGLFVMGLLLLLPFVGLSCLLEFYDIRHPIINFLFPLVSVFVVLHILLWMIHHRTSWGRMR